MGAGSCDLSVRSLGYWGLCSKLVPWSLGKPVKTATEVGVRAIQDHKVIEWNTCWKCRLSEGTDDM